MWSCHKCGKPVYFAERRQSVGYDWHPWCLRCEECGKVLNPGQHAQHKAVPYCHIPCYSALFGPKLFGHGSTTESHRSFGQRSKSFIRAETELSNRLKEYNRYHTESPRCQLQSREVNERLVIEGVLKIYWGTDRSVRLKEFDDNRVIARKKKSSIDDQYSEPCGDDADASPGSSLSCYFPPQLGDLSPDKLMPHPPDFSNIHSHLHKWKTINKLDEEGNVCHENFQLLESLVDSQLEAAPNNSLQQPFQSRMLQQVQRSQSMKGEVSCERLGVKSKKLQLHISNKVSIEPADSRGQQSEVVNKANAIDVDGLEDDSVHECKQPSGDKTVDRSPPELDTDEGKPDGSNEADDEDEEGADLPMAAAHGANNTMSMSFASFLQDMINNAQEEQEDDETEADISNNVSGQSESHDDVENNNNNSLIRRIEESVNHRTNTNIDNGICDNSSITDNSIISNTNSKTKNCDNDNNSVVEIIGMEDDLSTENEDKENVDISNTPNMQGDTEDDPKQLLAISRCSIVRNELKRFSLPPSPAHLISQAVALRKQKQAKPEPEPEKEDKDATGPRALRRRPGRRYDKRAAKLRRRSSINGHWYDRDTSVFTPPKDAAMTVWVTSLAPASEVLSELLTKYKIESDAGDFGLYVVKETGETRLIGDTEIPLLLRVNLGPHEDIAKIYLMNKGCAAEVSHKVAQFLNFSYAELRSFLNMFYEEEEREADRIRHKYHTMRQHMRARLLELGNANTPEETTN